MIQGPLVKAVVVLAAILIVLSFAVVAFPDHIAAIGAVAGVVAVAAIAVMVLILVRTRRASKDE